MIVGLPLDLGGVAGQCEAFIDGENATLWIDPTRDRYFVLLTNRVFGLGTLEEIRSVRRAFHDAFADV